MCKVGEGVRRGGYKVGRCTVGEGVRRGGCKMGGCNEEGEEVLKWGGVRRGGCKVGGRMSPSKYLLLFFTQLLFTVR